MMLQYILESNERVINTHCGLPMMLQYILESNERVINKHCGLPMMLQYILTATTSICIADTFAVTY
jgi:hypothetical protein